MSFLLVVRGGAPCRVPTWAVRTERYFEEKKLHELSENLSFNSDFVQVFVI